MSVVLLSPGEVRILQFARARREFTSADILRELAGTPSVFARLKRLSEELHLLDFEMRTVPHAKKPVRFFFLTDPGGRALDQLGRFVDANDIDIASTRRAIPLVLGEV